MHFWYILLLSLLAGCPALPPQQSYQAHATRVEALLDATVALTSPEGRVFCSGVLVEHQVVTAAHCVDDLLGASQAIAFRWQRNDDELSWSKTYDYVVVFQDIGNDIAVLSPVSPATPTGGAFVAPSAPLYGDRIVVVGHPLGLLWSLTEGRVSHPGRHSNGMHWMQVDAAVSPGNSGGPCYNSYGELVGVVSFRMGGPFGVEPHLAGIVHWDELTRALSTPE